MLMHPRSEQATKSAALFGLVTDDSWRGSWLSLGGMRTLIYLYPSPVSHQLSLAEGSFFQFFPCRGPGEIIARKAERFSCTTTSSNAGSDQKRILGTRCG